MISAENEKIMEDLPIDVLDLENRILEKDGETALAQACENLIEHWNNGKKHREVGLHLMFLCWYLSVEPPHLTGLNHKHSLKQNLQIIFNKVHDYYIPSLFKDAEMLYVIGTMAHLFPWALGNENVWKVRSIEYRDLYKKLKPDGIDPQIFHKRGAYGFYFSHVRIKDTY